MPQIRKVVQIRDSLYINIPKEHWEAMALKKGVDLEMFAWPGVGLVARTVPTQGNPPPPLEAIARLQGAAEKIEHDTRAHLEGMKKAVLHSAKELLADQLKGFQGSLYFAVERYRREIKNDAGPMKRVPPKKAG